jgi:membrane protease YdiL (CAAX protease family)
LTARDFFRDPTGALRPPWRLAIFGVSAAASLIAINGAVVPLVSWVLALVGVRIVLFPWALLAAVVLAHVLTFRWVDARGWRSVRLDATALNRRAVAWATLLGAASVAVPVAALLAAGWLRVEPSSPGSSVAAGLSIGLFLAPAALWEEMVFRGYAFTALQEWWGTAAALGVTSAAFGLIHFANAGATPASITVVVLAGVMLGGVLVVTRSLYAAFAAHLAWNWTLAGLFHSAVSGVPFPTPDYRVVDAGPDWATGGVWGPEGGAGAALGLGVATMYLYARQRRRGEP